MEVAGCFFHFSLAWLGFFLLLDNHRPGEQTAEIKSAKVIALISPLVWVLQFSELVNY